jgi:hypothetical protein
MFPVESRPTFRRNISPQCSESEKSVDFQRTTPLYIPDDSNLKIAIVGTTHSESSASQSQARNHPLLSNGLVNSCC